MGIFSDILLTVDYDRTLTAPDSTIPQRNLDAIAYFMENGGTFTVNTGRSIPMASSMLIPNVPVNAPLLLYNGSADYDKVTGQLTRYVPIDLDYAQVVSQLQARYPQLHVEIQALDAHYLIRPDTGWEKYCSHNGCAWRYTTPENIPQPFIKFSLYGQFRDTSVAHMYSGTPEELALIEEAVSFVQENWGDKLEVLRACPRIIDFHAKGVSKLNSARQLQKKLNKKILVCVGDAENDVQMLDGVDYAYCPADGIVADRYENVCKCADGAIADVIYKKIPDFLENSLTGFK